MPTRFAVLMLLAVALSGCGGSDGPKDNLVALRPGAQWVYRFTGTVTLPAAQGGGTQNVRESASTLTIQVPTATAKDAANADVRILDRNLDLALLDGRRVQADMRLYFTQLLEGVFVHGMNNSMGATAVAANDVFVPATATPAYQFLYLPDPVRNGEAVSYADPFGSAANGKYDLAVGAASAGVEVPAGAFLVKQLTQTEAFSKWSITNGGIAPAVGIISGQLQATLPDGTAVSGIIALQSYRL